MQLLMFTVAVARFVTGVHNPRPFRKKSIGKMAFKEKANLTINTLVL
jgi:hypothetical protein